MCVLRDGQSHMHTTTPARCHRKSFPNLDHHPWRPLPWTGLSCMILRATRSMAGEMVLLLGFVGPSALLEQWMATTGAFGLRFHFPRCWRAREITHVWAPFIRCDQLYDPARFAVQCQWQNLSPKLRTLNPKPKGEG